MSNGKGKDAYTRERQERRERDFLSAAKKQYDEPTWMTYWLFVVGMISVICLAVRAVSIFPR